MNAETSHLHELHESKFPFVTRIEFIRSKLSNFSAHVSGTSVLFSTRHTGCAPNCLRFGWNVCSKDGMFVSVSHVSDECSLSRNFALFIVVVFNVHLKSFVLRFDYCTFDCSRSSTTLRHEVTQTERAYCLRRILAIIYEGCLQD